MFPGDGTNACLILFPKQGHPQLHLEILAVQVRMLGLKEVIDSLPEQYPCLQVAGDPGFHFTRRANIKQGKQPNIIFVDLYDVLVCILHRPLQINTRPDAH